MIIETQGVFNVSKNMPYKNFMVFVNMDYEKSNVKLREGDTEYNNEDKTLAWAESWWNSKQINKNLTAKEEPIWKNLTQDRSELFREVDRISLVNAKWLEDQFCFKGPFWSRNYRFFRDKKPLTIIREVFNPNLETLLGYSGIKEFTKLYSSSS